MEEQNIYGLKYEVDIEELKTSTAEAKRKIQEANAEFNKSSSKLDNWATSVDGVSAKIEQLNKILEAEKTKLAQSKKSYNDNIDNITKYQKKIDELKVKKQQAISQYGEESEEVSNLSNEIVLLTRQHTKAVTAAEKLRISISNQEAQVNRTEKSIKNYEGQLEEVKEAQQRAEKSGRSLEDELKDIRKASNDTTESVEDLGDGFTVVKGAVANFVANALSSLISGMINAVEETREYRAELGKLQATAQTTGASFDNVKDNLKEVNAITNDTGAGVEGLNNLLSANFDGKLLDEITDQLLGASIKWKDTLKFEGLADGLQETLATGKAIGPFAELIERAGGSLEDFDTGLQKAIKSGNEQQYVLDYLSKYGLKDVKKAYEDNNKSLIESANATFEFNDRMAQLGEKAEPIITAIKKGFVSLFDEIMEGSSDADIEGIADTITDGFNGAKDVISWVKDNIKPITALVKGMATAWLTYKAATMAANTVTKVTNTLTKLKTAGTIADTTATTAHTVATNGATVATKALALAQKLTPWGMVAGAIGGVVVGLAALAKDTFSANEEQKKITETLEKEKDAWKEVKKAQEEQLASGLAEIDHVKNLKSELDTLVDANGKIKEGYETRASFIANELAEATGTEISVVDGVIQKYGELSNSIDLLIAKKRAKIILDSQEEAYSEALTKKTEALTKMNQFEEEMLAAEKERSEAKKAIEAAETEYEKQQAQQRYGLANAEYETKKKNYQEKADLVAGYNDTIAQYEYDAKLLASGNAEEIEKINSRFTASYDDKGKKVVLSLQEQITNEQALLDYWKEQYAKTNDEMYLDQISATEARIAGLQKEMEAQTSTIDNGTPNVTSAWGRLTQSGLNILNQNAPLFLNEANRQVNNFNKGVKNGKPGTKKAYEDLTKKGIEGAESQYDNAYSAGGYLSGGINAGVQDSKTTLGNTMSGLAWTMIDNFKRNLKIQSPSKVFRDLAAFIPQGIKNGIEKNKGMAVNAMNNMTQRVIKAGEKLKDSIALDEVKGRLEASVQRVANGGVAYAGANNNVNNVTFNQYNTSPKALDSLEVYRNTQKQIRQLKVWKGGN